PRRGTAGRGEGESAPCRACGQKPTTSLQPAAQGAWGETELARRVVPPLALKVAEDQVGAVTLRQSLQLLIGNGLRFSPAQLGFRVPGCLRPGFVFALPSARLFAFEVGRDGASHAMEPAPERRSPADGGGLADQHQKGGLEDVLRVLCIR